MAQAFFLGARGDFAGALAADLAAAVALAALAAVGAGLAADLLAAWARVLPALLLLAGASESAVALAEDRRGFLAASATGSASATGRVASFLASSASAPVIDLRVVRGRRGVAAAAAARGGLGLGGEG